MKLAILLRIWQNARYSVNRKLANTIIIAALIFNLLSRSKLPDLTLYDQTERFQSSSKVTMVTKPGQNQPIFLRPETLSFLKLNVNFPG